MSGEESISSYNGYKLVSSVDIPGGDSVSSARISGYHVDGNH